MATTILVVEDEEKIGRFLELELLHEGYRVIKAVNGREGLEKAESGQADLMPRAMRFAMTVILWN